MQRNLFNQEAMNRQQPLIEQPAEPAVRCPHEHDIIEFIEDSMVEIGQGIWLRPVFYADWLSLIDLTELRKMVEFGKYKEMPVGEKVKAKISAINEGTQADFRSEEYWENSDLSKNEIAETKKKPAVEIVTDNGARLIINLPQSEVLHPKTTLAVFKRTYGKFPVIGMDVETKMDENGFFRIVLEN